MSSSSLDPLAEDSDIPPSASPRRPRSQKISPRKPLRTISGNAQTREFFVSASSPKSSKQQPWCLKMTLEAQRGMSLSPIRDAEQCQTTTVPLKDGDGNAQRAPRGSPCAARSRTTDLGLRPRSRTRSKGRRLEITPRRVSQAFLSDSDTPCDHAALSPDPNTPPLLSMSPSNAPPGRVSSPLSNPKSSHPSCSNAQTSLFPKSSHLSFSNAQTSLLPSNVSADSSVSKIRSPSILSDPSTPLLNTLASPSDLSLLNTGLPGKNAMRLQDPQADMETDTVLLSEGFSMVSVDSLPSAAHRYLTPESPVTQKTPGSLHAADDLITPSTTSPTTPLTPQCPSTSKVLPSPDVLASAAAAGRVLQGIPDSPVSLHGGSRLASPFPDHHSPSRSTQGAHTPDRTLLDRQAEWQREREAVSQQIRAANASQVIVIDETLGVEHDPRETAYCSGDNQSEHVIDETGLGVEIDLRETTIGLKDSQSDLTSKSIVHEASPHSVHGRTDMIERNEKVSGESIVTPLKNTRGAAVDKHHKNHPVDDCNALIDSANAVTEDPITQTERAKAIQRTEAVAERPKATTEKAKAKKARAAQKPRKQIPPSWTIDPALQALSDIDPALRCLSLSTSPACVPNEPVLGRTEKHSPSPPRSPLQTKTHSTATEPVVRRETANRSPIPKPSKSRGMQASESDILASSIPEPLALGGKWTMAHSRALEPLVNASTFYSTSLFQARPHSNALLLVGRQIEAPGGWSRRFTAADAGVLDAFLLVLRKRGTRHEGEDMIGTREIARQMLKMWVVMVVQGEVQPQDWAGVRIGRGPSGKRWRPEDIVWKANRSLYFEEKRREFRVHGLPSSRRD